MKHCFALTFLLVLVDAVHAQPGPGSGKEPGWIEQFDGTKLDGWGWEGESSIVDKTLVLGGAKPTGLWLKTPLGERFKLRLEYKWDGAASPRLSYGSAGSFGGRRPFSDGNLPSRAGSWMAYRIEGQPVPEAGGYRVEHSHEGGGGSGTHGGVTEINFLEIHIPAGTTLSIRRVQLQTDRPPDSAEEGGSLVIPLLVLSSIIFGVIAWGWYRNRRAISLPPVPPNR
jgi:hypothetical protein